MMQGIVIALNFGTFLIDVGGIHYLCHFPKTDKQALKPVVGDKVILDEEGKSIVNVLPRQSFIKRPRIANIARLYVVTSLKEPAYSFLLNAMFLTFAKFYNLDAALVINKIDMVHHDAYPSSLNYFKQIGLPLYYVSTKTKEGIAELIHSFGHGIYAFSGQTGVGKSSLLNVIDPLMQRSIGDYSHALGRGKHQTKEVVLFRYKDSFIADTPGFSSLELVMNKKDAAINFPGFDVYMNVCKFSNCTHTTEPECGVKLDVERGKIPLEVYEAYCRLIQKLPDYKEYS
jgi:ribosome biogenesis GTPase / thiamine phosphate phosphatase